MKRWLAIAVIVYLAFLAEFVLNNAFGAWGKPELLVMVIVFCDLCWGIRYSLWAGAIAGILKESFSIDPFGTYLLVYIAAAYLSTFVRRNLYQPGSRFSRALVVGLVVIGVFTMETLLHMRLFEVRLLEAMGFIFVPRLVLTTVAVTFVFQYLRQASYKFKL